MENRERRTRVSLIQRLDDYSDVEAWSRFRDFYWRCIRHWAMRKGCDETMAEDVFQETVISIMKSDYNPDLGSFTAFIKKIAERRAIDLLRRERQYYAMSRTPVKNHSEMRDTALEYLDPVDSEQVELEMDSDWLHGAISQALKQAYARVSQETYKSFCLYVLDQLPAEEVCRKLNIPRKGTLFERKSNFLRILEDEFFGFLEQLEGVPSRNIMKRREAFTKTLEELIVDKPHLRETDISETVPVEVSERVELVRNILAQYPPPDKLQDVNALFIKIDDSGKWQKLGNRNYLIGRIESADIELPVNGVSGSHATLTYSPCGYLLKDEHSTNGTVFNGKKIDSETFLSSGDFIQIAEAAMLFL